MHLKPLESLNDKISQKVSMTKTIKFIRHLTAHKLKVSAYLALSHSECLLKKHINNIRAN